MDQVSLVIILLAALLIPLIMAKFKINSLPTASWKSLSVS